MGNIRRKCPAVNPVELSLYLSWDAFALAKKAQDVALMLEGIDLRDMELEVSHLTGVGIRLQRLHEFMKAAK